MEENSTDFEEFAAAFNGDGYQTEGPENTETAETAQQDSDESVQESTEASEETEQEESVDPGGEESKGEESGAASQDPPSEQKFTIKVNKESREVNLAEITELAQKGADYDRVKGQLANARKSLESAQSELAESRNISELVKRIAEDVKSTPEEMLRRIHINWRMNQGETEKEAIAHIDAENARRELNSLKEKQAQEKSSAESSQERASREIAEFRKEFPDVEITKELVEDLMQDVQDGMSFLNAYRKRESSMKDAEANSLRAEIAKLQQQLKAEQQNKKNRSNTPGSQTDAGGRNEKSDFDEFAEAFR